MNIPVRKIRRAKADDIDTICAFDQESAGTERKDAIRRATDSENSYVLEQDGRVIALGILEYTFFEQGFISLVYVDPRERRTGAGEMLLRHLVSACRTPRLFSSTSLTNIPMQALFAKLGFEVSGVVHNLDPKDPELVYYKADATESEDGLKHRT
jgi:N-acetylglutamate synthase-like GNAT family acetyltransferase